jgi:hypothetical protein
VRHNGFHNPKGNSYLREGKESDRGRTKGYDKGGLEIPKGGITAKPNISSLIPLISTGIFKGLADPASPSFLAMSLFHTG